MWVSNNVQGWVNKGSDMIGSDIEKQMIRKTIIFTFCLFEPRNRGTSIRHKERREFSLHSFCSFCHNFGEHVLELPRCFAQFLSKGH